jgi:transketolase
MALELQHIAELGAQLRVDSIRCTTAAGSGHPTSSMSAADLMAVLMAKYLRYDWDDPENPAKDHLIFSKGHARPPLYAMYKSARVITDKELMSLRKVGSRLEGHRIIREVESQTETQLKHDSSTNALIRRYRNLKKGSS